MERFEVLKENVIIGKLIPAGTGVGFERETNRLIAEKAEELRQKRIERNKKANKEEENFTKATMVNQVENDELVDLEEKFEAFSQDIEDTFAMNLEDLEELTMD